MNFKEKSLFSLPSVDYVKLRIKLHSRSAVVTIHLIGKKIKCVVNILTKRKVSVHRALSFFSWDEKQKINLTGPYD